MQVIESPPPRHQQPYEHRPHRPRRTAILVAIATLGTLGAVVGSATHRVEAAWLDAETATGSYTAGTVSPVTSMTCTAGLLQPVTFNWTAPVGGLTRTGYRWTVTGGLNGSGTLAANATSLQLSTGLLGLGSGTFSLFAVYDTDGAGPVHWESLVKTGSLTFATVVLDVVSSCSVP